MHTLGGKLTNELQFQLTVDIANMDRHHPSTELAVRELLDDLNDTPNVSTKTGGGQSQDGTKGTLDTLLVTATPLAIPAIVRLFRLWLTRDKDRSVNITITKSNQPSTTVNITGDNISSQALEQVITESFKNIHKRSSN
jgi:hypothetical protein